MVITVNDNLYAATGSQAVMHFHIKFQPGVTNQSTGDNVSSRWLEGTVECRYWLKENDTWDYNLFHQGRGLLSKIRAKIHVS